MHTYIGTCNFYLDNLRAALCIVKKKSWIYPAAIIKLLEQLFAFFIPNLKETLIKAGRWKFYGRNVTLLQKGNLGTGQIPRKGRLKSLIESFKDIVIEKKIDFA